MSSPFKSLTFWIFVSLILGLLSGHIFGEAIIPFADFVSNVFLRLLKMAIFPLMITAIISGLINIESDKGVEILGLKTLTFFFSTTIIAIITGLILAMFFSPGTGAPMSLVSSADDLSLTSKTFTQLIIDIIPANPFKAFAEGQVLAIITFTALLGYFMSKLSPEYKSQLTAVINPLFEAVLKLTTAIMWTAPIGVFGYNAIVMATTGLEGFIFLGQYFLVAIAGILIHSLLTLPGVVYFFTKENPFKIFKKALPPLTTAFSTCSVAVALPLTIKSLTENLGVSKKIASFVGPLGAVMNKNGTALYQAVAVMFIAQAYGVELDLTNLLIIVITALLAAIATANVPMSGLVMMSMILSAIGLPIDGVTMVIAVDRFVDMFRSCLNALGDIFGAVIIDRLESK